MTDSKECYIGDKSGIATPLSVLRVDQVTFRAPAPFSLGTDASVWLARMEEYLQQNGIPPDRWTSVARSFLSDDVYAQVMQWPLRVNAPFADFAKMFAERYSPIESTLDARAKFVSRRQLPGESLNAYADAIMLLGRKANCDDTLVRDQFFLGLRNAELKRQLYSSRNEPWQQFLSIAREADFANQLFPTDTAHAGVVQPSAENERFQPSPSPDAETADPHRAISAVRADTSSDIDRLVEALRRVLTEEIRGPNMPPHQQRRRAYRRPTAARARESRCYNCGGQGHLSRSVPRGPQCLQLPRPPTGRSQQEAVYVVAFTKPSSIFVQANVAGTDSQLLLDTGAAVTLISEDLFNSLSPKRELQPVYVRLLSASGNPLDVLGTCRLPIRFAAQSFAHTLFVTRNLAFPGLLGADFLLSNGCVINLDDNVLRVGSTEVHLEHASQIRTADTSTKPCRAVLRDTVLVPGRSEILVYACCPAIPERTECVFSPSPLLPDRHAVVAANSVGTVTSDSRIAVRLLNPDPAPVTLYAGSTVGELTPLPEAHSVRYVNQVVPPSGANDHNYRRIIDEMLPPLEEVDAHSRNALRSVLWKYRRCIATSDEDMGHTELASHRIDTRNAAPVKVPPRRLPPAQRPDVQRMVTDMLNRNVIEPANSPWSAPIVIVRKKDGSPRFCVDFRRLNDVTTKDAHPLPRIDDTLEALSGARWFSTLDFSSGYWQIPVEEADRPKTAFSTPFGLYQFRVMPFGLCNAPATFQRLMDVALRGLTWSSCLAYLDDIIVFGRTAREHTDRLERVLQRIAETGLKLKPQKCHLMRKTVRFLGHVLSENGISTDEEKTRAVKEWATPCCPSEVRQFLGLASYYRRFIKNFSMVSAPLNALLRKGSHWKWTAECQTAFDKLKHMLCTAPVLTFPDFNLPFIVDVDASAEGIGAVLSQPSHGNERVVAYASRTLTKAERRYCVTRKELLALVWSIKEFRPYLYGQQFDVRTDHSCLRWLRNFKEPEGQVARWLEQLAEYDFNVLHRPGRAHCNADALSRQRCPQCGISIVAAASPPVVSMEEVAPSRCSSIADIHTWLQAQSTDTTLSALRNWLDANRWPRHCPTSSDPDLRSLWRDGKGVFRVDENGLLRRRQAGGDHVVDQLLVPKELRNDVLAAMHNSTFGGHFASRRTLDRLQRRYFWPRMRKAVDAWCQVCRTCAARNEPTRKAKAPLQMPETSCAFQTLAMDFLGPLEATPKGHRYILVVCDYFSKWTEAYPTRSQTATEVADALVNNWFSRFGAPIRLHSDQGRSFESSLISEVCKIFGVEKTRSSPYHPQGNGLVERANRTLLNTLAKLCHESQDRSWDQLLPLATMAYNSAAHETTGQSPFCMLFGKQMSLPLDITLDAPPGTACNAEDYVVQLRENLQKVHSMAFDRSRSEQQRHKEIADRKATANRFETDQLVWLKVPQKGKMDMRWSGPLRVVKQLGIETYRVQDVKRPRRRLVVHSDRLKSYHTDTHQDATTGGNEPPGGSGDVLRTTWTFKGPTVRPDTRRSHAQEDVQDQAAERDRPQRVRRPPRRFDDFVWYN
ncbi:Retrovirus-related Pol polyprotein from transposon [Trichinella pseudospiralis]|uniref:RNA-directed DNA polymerase n=3 Tax=Trichinella pseudospiralis TaxID=6337 RepID=A0A0V1DU22_TRIPS|nr:Retrovirus-related Pol polyprotein from transposon [Trichinella pseudospiralis]